MDYNEKNMCGVNAYECTFSFFNFDGGLADKLILNDKGIQTDGPGLRPVSVKERSTYNE